VVSQPYEDIVVLRTLHFVIIVKSINDFLKLFWIGHVSLVVLICVGEYTVHPVDVLFVSGRSHGW
jgi:hypothetical protein